MRPRGAYAVAALFLLLVWVIGPPWAVDPGGYKDRFTERTPSGGRRLARDKAVHAALGGLLCLAALALGGFAPPAALLFVAACGVGWELVEARPRKPIPMNWPHGGTRRGFFSWRDVVADEAGACLVALPWWGALALLRR